MKIDDNNENRNDYSEDEKNVCTLDSVSDNDIVIKDKKFDLSAEELNELLNMNHWDDLTDALKKKILMIE